MAPRGHCAMRTVVVGVIAVTLGCLSSHTDAFSVAPPSSGLARSPTLPVALSTRASGWRASVVSRQASHSRAISNVNGEKNRFHLFRKRVSKKGNGLLTNRKLALMRKFRRMVALVWTASLFYLGGAKLHSAPSHASSATVTATPQVRLVAASAGGISSASLDQTIDRYVKDHMFDDDAYDPVESAFREAYSDATTGQYPAALQEINAEILGQKQADGVAASAATDDIKTVGGMSALVFTKIFDGLKKASAALEKKFGISQSLSQTLVIASILVTFPIAILYGYLSYASNQRRWMMKFNKKRYGDDYDLDATIREDDEVEAPDDDDDDEDDDDDDDDDDE